jgi:hypothetical protein
LIFVHKFRPELIYKIDPSFICDNPAHFRSESSEMGYCCEEHRQLHQPEDEPLPFPFFVKFRPEIGR